MVCWVARYFRRASANMQASRLERGTVAASRLRCTKEKLIGNAFASSESDFVAILGLGLPPADSSDHYAGNQ